MKQSVATNGTGDNNLISGRSVFQAAYQLDLGKWQPYAGMNVGAFYGASVNDDASFGPEVGIKYYVNETTFLYGNMAYDVPFVCADVKARLSAAIGFYGRFPENSKTS
jgi:hypothetical protein